MVLGLGEVEVPLMDEILLMPWTMGLGVIWTQLLNHYLHFVFFVYVKSPSHFYLLNIYMLHIISIVTMCCVEILARLVCCKLVLNSSP